MQTKRYAVYLRLSKEDDRDQEESNSIVNQRKLIYDYIYDHLHISRNDIMEFVDDGCSGTNFERPAMKQMLQLVQERKIAGILVKDLSRFGRDHITVGEYLEHIFPFLQIRFIAVNDEFDSDEYKDNIPGLEVAYKNLFNEFYSTFLSDNIKKTLYQKWESGQCIHSVPYGYIKRKGEGNKLFLDPVTSLIVKEVFELTLQGIGRNEIARKMNEKGVLTPGDYRKGKALHVWTSFTVLNIIKNENYTGAMIAGRYRRPEIGKTFAIKVPKEQWKRYENAHPAIVSKEDFRQANEHIQKSKFSIVQSPGKQGLLTGMLICGYCGHNMRKRSRRGKSDAYYCGYGNNGSTNGCLRKSCDQIGIIQAVFPVIKMQLQLLFEAQEILVSADHERKKRMKYDWKKKSECNRTIEKLKNKKLHIYHNWKKCSIAEEVYLVQREELSRQIDNLSNQLVKLEEELAMHENADLQKSFISQFEEFRETTNLTKELLNSFVDKIYIWDIQHIKIVFRYPDQMSEILETVKKV